MIEGFIGLLKLFIRYRKCYIDERVFRLHCIFTSLILLFCCAILTTKQIAGDPIDCDTNRDSIKPSLLNTYCLIHYTYTIRDGFFKRLGIDVAAPGVKYGPKDDEIHYNYYQWIWFLFFMEALFFYIPRWLWKGWESGTMAHLVTDVTEFSSEKKKKSKKRFIVNFLVGKNQNDSYGRSYMFCMFLAFLNVLIQMLFINFLFNGEFYTYGLQVFFFLYEDPDTRGDALIKVFPRVTKCRFNKFGSSGSIQELDALCVLPLNMYNEIIFVFLWFWFFFLAVLLFLSIAMKLVLIISPTVRLFYIQKEFRLEFSWKPNEEKYFDPKHLTFGNALVLILIKQNTGHVFSREVAKDFITKKRQLENKYNKNTRNQFMKNVFVKELKERVDNIMDRNNKKNNGESTNSNSYETVALFEHGVNHGVVIEMSESKVGSESEQ